MADYKSCAWYQNGTCIRDDKSEAPISCADCEDYERRVVFKIEDLQERNAETEHDAVNHPNHYCKGGVECIDAIKAALGDKYEGFLAGNVLKYVYRYPDKNGVEDCKKARFYLDKLIEVLSNEER